MVDADDLTLPLAELGEKEDGRAAFPGPDFQCARGFGLDEREKGLPRLDVEAEPILGRCENKLLFKRDGLSAEMSVGCANSPEANL